MTMCDQHLTEIYSALLLQINKEHSLTVIQSHLSANHNKERVNLWHKIIKDSYYHLK